MRLLMIASLALAGAGCAAQAPLAKSTQSGKAETVLKNITLDRAKQEMALICAKTGGELKTDTYSVACGKRNDSGKGMMAQVLMGNRLSQTPWEWVRFTLVPTGTDVFVTAEAWMEMTMGFGEVKRIPYDNNNTRNQIQAGLDAAAANWNSGPARQGGAVPAPPVAPARPETCESCKKIGGG